MKRQVNLWLMILPLSIALLMTVGVASIFRFLPPRLPLFYSLAWGEGQLATGQQFLILPAGIVLITLLNLVISWQLHPQQIFFKKVLTFSPVIISIILGLTFIKIVLNFI